MVYEGNKVDLWSAGIILYVMLIGNTIWAEPSLEDKDFYTFLQNYPHNLTSIKEWTRLSPLVIGMHDLPNSCYIDLLSGLLNIDPAHRYTISDVIGSEWFKM